MNTINNLEIGGLVNNYNKDFEQTGEKIEGINGLILVGIETYEIPEFVVSYSDIEKALFLRALIDGNGDLWKGEWSEEKGQRVLGEYIVHADYIEPDITARFVLAEKFYHLTVIIDKPERQIITHYDSDYTDKFSNVNFIEVDGKSILIDTVNIHQLYLVPEIVPEDFAKEMCDSGFELIPQPHVKINSDLYICDVGDPDSEAVGRGESFDFTARRINE